MERNIGDLSKLDELLKELREEAEARGEEDQDALIDDMEDDDMEALLGDDDEDRHYLEFELLPGICDMVNDGEQPEGIFEHVGERCPDAVNAAGFFEPVETMEIMGRKAYLYTFPQPEDEPDAYYGLVAKNHEDRWTYYTLESADEGRNECFVCEVSTEAHHLRRHINGKVLSKQEFAEWVAKDLERRACR